MEPQQRHSASATADPSANGDQGGAAPFVFDMEEAIRRAAEEGLRAAEAEQHQRSTCEPGLASVARDVASAVREVFTLTHDNETDGPAGGTPQD